MLRTLPLLLLPRMTRALEQQLREAQMERNRVEAPRQAEAERSKEADGLRRVENGSWRQAGRSRENEKDQRFVTGFRAGRYFETGKRLQAARQPGSKRRRRKEAGRLAGRG